MTSLEELGFIQPTPATEAEKAATLDKGCKTDTVSADSVEVQEMLRAVSGQCGTTTATTEKALNLLGSGISSEQTASALGVTPARISQLLAEESFAAMVSALRYKNLQKHNVRDNAYDEIEDVLLVKLKKAMPLLIKPESILSAMKIVNGAKRRGQSAPQQTNAQQLVVTLTLPTVIANQFSVDMNNQVVSAGDQSLLTMPSGNLLDRVEAAQEAKLLSEEKPYVPD